VRADAATAGKTIVLVDGSQVKPVFDFLKVNYTAAASVSEALKTNAALYVFSGLDLQQNCTAQELAQLKEAAGKGAKLLFLDAGKVAKYLYPEYILGSFAPTEGDIANMDIPESPVFNELELLDLRYFNNNKREVPVVCNAALSVLRGANVDILAKHIKIHGYVNGEMEQRAAYMSRIQGATLVKIKENGTAILSTLSLEKGITDPVAGRLLKNILADLLK
jgi:hypothetical protein